MRIHCCCAAVVLSAIICICPLEGGGIGVFWKGFRESKRGTGVSLAGLCCGCCTQRHRDSKRQRASLAGPTHIVLMSVPERLVGRGGKVIWDRDRESNALPDPGALVREIRSPDGATGAWSKNVLTLTRDRVPSKNRETHPLSTNHRINIGCLYHHVIS